MSNHFPYSYEQELKDQVAERLGAFERLRRADAFDRRRPSILVGLAGSVGRALVRLGTWLEQPGRRLDQAAGYGAERRG
jgi:hypothetical protein